MDNAQRPKQPHTIREKWLRDWGTTGRYIARAMVARAAPPTRRRRSSALTTAILMAAAVSR